MSGKGPNSKLNQSYIKYSLVKSNARKKCEVKRQLIANLNEFFSHGKKKVVRRVWFAGFGSWSLSWSVWLWWCKCLYLNTISLMYDVICISVYIWTLSFTVFTILLYIWYTSHLRLGLHKNYGLYFSPL